MPLTVRAEIAAYCTGTAPTLANANTPTAVTTVKGAHRSRLLLRALVSHTRTSSALCRYHVLHVQLGIYIQRYLFLFSLL